METFIWQNMTPVEQSRLLQRPLLRESSLANIQLIIDSVRSRGDEALKEFTQKFDACQLIQLSVSEGEFEEALALVDSKVTDAVDCALQNIEAFHRPQLRERYDIEVEPGQRLSREIRPLSRIGLYVPGGSAPLLSTLLMLAVPAKLAGCRDIILCTPSDSEGKIDPALLATALRLGIRTVFKVGGAQAIAAMAYGTQSVPKVDKIFGPGNAWVTGAKRLVAQDSEGAAIDMPAGPSELMVVADSSSEPRFVASDLLSQAEHGPDSQVILLSLDRSMIDAVKLEIETFLSNLSRSDVIRQSLAHSRFILMPDMESVFRAIDSYAPEHLSLQIPDPESCIERIVKAGSVFCGPWTPEAAGDYASGTNHVLPTGGWARSLSGLSVESFQRTMSVQSLSSDALDRLGPTLRQLAVTEGLAAHELSVTVRLEHIAKGRAKKRRQSCE